MAEQPKKDHDESLWRWHMDAVLDAMTREDERAHWRNEIGRQYSWISAARDLLRLVLPDRAKGCLCRGCLLDETRDAKARKQRESP